MRPASIVTFERIIILVILLGFVTTALTWDGAVAMARRQGIGESLLIALGALSLAINLLLLWLIARRRSAAAKWIFILLSAGGLAMALIGAGAIASLPLPLIMLNVVQWLLTLYAIWLLFRPDSRGWFGGGDSGSG